MKIGCRHIAIPAVASLFSLIVVLGVAANIVNAGCSIRSCSWWAESDDLMERGVLTTALTISLIYCMTFVWRSIWLVRMRKKKFLLVKNGEGFAPERAFYFGLTCLSPVIGASMLLGNLVTPDFFTITSSEPLKWMIGLLFTVPLYEAYVGKWRKLQVEARHEGGTGCCRQELVEYSHAEVKHWPWN